MLVEFRSPIPVMSETVVTVTLLLTVENMGARRGWQGGGGPLPPWNLKKNDVICCHPKNYPKNFARAYGARNKCPIVQPKSPEKHKNFRLRLRHAKKWSIFCTARRKHLNFLKCRWFCPPLENFLRAPMGRFIL